MALFSPRTVPQIMKDFLATLLANTPLNDVNFGSIWTSLLEAAAQEDDEQYFQMLEIIRGYSLDTVFGDDLVARAQEYSIEKRLAARASTLVTLADTAITKVSTGVFAGLSGPPAASMTINGNTKTGFPAAGAIVIGRGTPNVEKIAYSSITDFTNYVRFNLTAALASDHGTDESIILAQGGDRLVASGTIVKVPASDISPQIIFTLDSNATILDGESSLSGVPVTAVNAGSVANVPVGAVQRFDSAPFATATVRNPARVTNGLDDESDPELRDRIKSTIQALGRGTPTAIRTGVLGLVSQDDNKRVVSVSMRATTNPAEVVKLFIDDGTGFIPTFAHVGVEVVNAGATGGEKFLNASNFPLVKAFTETQFAQPYNIASNQTLFVEVNGVVETITFVSADFAAPGAGTAQEVLRKINANAQTFEARVSSAGTKVRIFARTNSEEEIRATGGTANTALGFAVDVKFTAKLYLERANAVTLLTKDGRTASLESGATAAYDLSDGPRHLSFVVDGKVRSVLKAWFDPAFYVNAAAVTAQQVCDAILAQCSGVDASPSSNNTRFALSSKTKRLSTSRVRVVSDFTTVLNEESSLLVNRTTEAKTAGGNVTMFATQNDYLYLGHADVPFDSVFVRLATLASASITPFFEIWKGGVVNAWSAVGVHDDTQGFTQNGHILFAAPLAWAKTTVSGVSAYWLRIQRTRLTLTTPPVESRLRIAGANEAFQFDETEVAGATADYAINRFVGQIELVSPLVAGDAVTLGSFETRPFGVSGTGNFSGLVGQTLTMLVDGLSKSLTFLSGDFTDPASATAGEIVTAINDRVFGVTAVTVAAATQAKVQTNRWSAGSLSFVAGGANTTLNFPTGVLEGFVAHVPAMESTQGPWTFALDDTLIVIIDDNFAATLTVPLFKQGVVAAGGSASLFADATLSTTFPTDDLIAGHHVVFKDGPNAGQRRTITFYDGDTGEITVSSPFPSAPAAGNKFQVLPTAVADTVAWLQNKQLTLVTTKAEVRGSDAGRRLQIASLTASENAAVAVSGGNANTKLVFPAEHRGVDGYRYFTGLAQKVQWTVDGREDDQEEYQGIRAAGVHVEVLEPVTIPVVLSIQVTTREGVSLSGIVNSIKSAVSNYISRLAVGEDVILSEITVAVKAVAGVFDAQIRAPVANIAIADNELARIAEGDIGIV